MIALYPGAFKPPHRGHFEVVKSLLNGTHNGQVYTKDCLLYTSPSPRDVEESRMPSSA